MLEKILFWNTVIFISAIIEWVVYKYIYELVNKINNNIFCNYYFKSINSGDFGVPIYSYEK